jgi:septin 7
MSVSPKSSGRFELKTTASSVSSLSATGSAQATRVVTARTDVTVTHVNTDATNTSTTATPNGPTSPPTRASPVPNQASVPNGKPASPLVATSNAMPNGGTTAPQTVTSKDPKAAAQAASDMRNIVRRKLTGYVGFANLPNQWHRKSVRKGFNFNVMVVGMSKTT